MLDRISLKMPNQNKGGHIPCLHMVIATKSQPTATTIGALKGSLKGKAIQHRHRLGTIQLATSAVIGPI